MADNISQYSRSMKTAYSNSLKKIKDYEKSQEFNKIPKECDIAITIVKDFKTKLSSEKTATSKIVIDNLLSVSVFFLISLLRFDVSMDEKETHLSARLANDKDSILKATGKTVGKKALDLGTNAIKIKMNDGTDIKKDLFDKAKIDAIRKCNQAIKKLEKIKDKYKDK